jgi:ubiquinone/menaquinone biosynthesis C-methylase UbiE
MTPEEEAQQIFAERSAFYSRSAVHKDPEVLKRIVKLANLKSNALALDIATGSGHTALALAPHVAGVVCIDLTQQMIGEARKLSSAQGTRKLQFFLADAHALPFRDEAFSAITCRRAAHHFSNIMQALREIRQSLSPDGTLVIDDRTVPDDDFVDSCMNELDRLHDESHVREYRASEWCRMLEASGFRVDVVEPYFRHLPLTSLTENVSPENTKKIQAIMEGLSDEQREAMNVRQVGGKIHLNHWYVMLCARLDHDFENRTSA